MAASSMCRTLLRGPMDRICQLESPFELKLRSDINPLFPVPFAIDGENFIMRGGEKLVLELF